MPAGPLRNRFPGGFDDLANALYPYVATHPELKLDPAQSVKGALAELLGIPIDNYVLVVCRCCYQFGLTLHITGLINDTVVVKVDQGVDSAVVKTTIEKQMNKRDKVVSVMDSKATLATIFTAFGAITTFVTAMGEFP